MHPGQHRDIVRPGVEIMTIKSSLNVWCCGRRKAQWFEVGALPFTANFPSILQITTRHGTSLSRASNHVSCCCCFFFSVPWLGDNRHVGDGKMSKGTKSFAAIDFDFLAPCHGRDAVTPALIWRFYELSFFVLNCFLSGDFLWLHERSCINLGNRCNKRSGTIYYYLAGIFLAGW